MLYGLGCELKEIEELIIELELIEIKKVDILEDLFKDLGNLLNYFYKFFKFVEVCLEN